MSQISELRKEIDKSLEVKAIEFKAVMGRADGEVKVSQNEVYVTLMNGSVVTVYNDRLPRIAFRKVIIGYDDNDPSLLQVLRFDNVYSSRPTAMIVNHKESHAWYSHDPIDVYAQQVLPLLPRAVGGLSVRVYGGEYKLDTQYHVLPTTDYDLSAEAPASGAEWVNVEIDSSGVVTYNHGSNKASRELLLPEDIPTTVSTKKLLCSIKMYIGQSRFIQTRLDSDIFDPRFTGESSAVWGAITGALSDQADLQTALNGKQPLDDILTSLAGLAIAAGDVILGLTSSTLQRLGVGVDTSDSKFLKRGTGPGYLHSWATPTTSEISESTNKRYVTDANLTVIGNTSGINTGDEHPAMVLISEVELASAAATIDFSSIPSTYRHLKIVYSVRLSAAAGAAIFAVVVNNDTGANYETTLFYYYDSAAYGTIANAGSNLARLAYVTANTALANSFGGGEITIYDYKNTNKIKYIQTRAGIIQSVAIKPESYDGSAVWKSTAAINRLTFKASGGSDLMAYSVISLYGIK